VSAEAIDRPGLRRWARPAVGLVVAALFLWLIARRVDWPAVWRLAVAAQPGFLLLGLMALAGGFTVRIARWWMMLRALDPRVRFGDCVRPFLVSLAVNNTVPLRAGDVVRAFGFRDALGVAPPRVLGTLVLERVLDLLALLLVFFPGLLGVASGAVPRGFIIAGAVLGVACVVAVLTFVLAPGPLSRLVSAVLRSGPLSRLTAAERAAGWARQFFESFAPLGEPRLAVRLVLLSLLAWGLEGSMYAATAHAVGAQTAAGGPWFALATGTLATLLPSSPGYVGTFDYFAMLGLTAYGASRTAAAAFALLVHVILWLPVTLAGGIAALRPRARLLHGRAPVESA
jgi:uncharacterized protein (TIRG00374 family)